MSNKRLVDYLNLQNNNALIAIENEKISISGANEDIIQHSSMFYQPFGENACQRLCKVFEIFMNSSINSSRRKCLSGVQRIIDSETEDDIVNMECLLYASRVCNTKIVNDSVMFDDMADIISKSYEKNPESSFEAVKHIFKTWNWDCQIGLALIASITAERNPVKREQLLSEMDKYILKQGDKLHKLLLYKVKAMVIRKNEYCSKLFDIVVNLNNTINNDSQIASIIKQYSPEIFSGNENLFDRVTVKNVLAKSTVKNIKQILGFNETDDIVNMIILGNENETTRKTVERFMAQENTNVERYCGVIRKNHLDSYLDVFERLLERGNLNIHNKCCISLTYSQMTKSDTARFDDFLKNNNFPDDFCYLLRYVNGNGRAFINLDKATDMFFNDNCSSLLKKGIKHTSKYDENISKSVLDNFGYLVEEKKEQTPYIVLEKIDDLLNDQKSIICNKVTKGSRFLVQFDELLQNEQIDLDSNPNFFDAMIDIIHHCPPNTIGDFYYNIYKKTSNKKRQERVRKMMEDIGVIY